MRGRLILGMVLLMVLGTVPGEAGERLILRAPGEMLGDILLRNGLELVRELDDPNGELFVVRIGSGLSMEMTKELLAEDLEVAAFEEVRDAHAPEITEQVPLGLNSGEVYDALADRTEVDFFGVQAWVGYARQPAAEVVGLPTVHEYVTGAAVVAVIDTGVDFDHPLLAGVLLPGYDFVNDLPEGSEWNDIDLASLEALEGLAEGLPEEPQVVELNQSTAWILEQSTAWILEGLDLPDAFGHGTMVAGIVHLAAPTAQIMPLKAFTADGTADTEDIVRAIYYAVDNGADVINMSFSLGVFSPEVMRAVNYANRNGLVCVAAAGNSGEKTLVFPAALGNSIGVASTNYLDERSEFSNFGDDLVVLAAPGERIVTTFPTGGYAAGWGTSFSAPLVAGGVALLKELLEAGGLPEESYFQAIEALSHAFETAPGLGYGRLDLFAALESMGTQYMGGDQQ